MRIRAAASPALQRGRLFFDFLKPDPMPLRLKLFIYYWLPLLLFCGFIYFQSSYPSPKSVITFAFSDKLLHVFAYAVLAILFLRAYGTLSLRNHKRLLLVVSILSAALYGLSDEIHQYFVPARNAELWDLIADIVGSVGGAVLYQMRRPLKEPD